MAEEMGPANKYRRNDYTKQPIVAGRPNTNSSNTSLEVKSKAKRPRKRKYFLLISAILVCAVLLYFFVINKKNETLPAKLTSQVNYPIFYPKPLPSGYNYQKDSAKVERGILFYNLAKDKNTVFVSEQPVPAAKPDFASFQKTNSNYRKLDVPAGQALIGVSSTEPFGILLSNTTMVNIHADKQVPLDVMTKLVNNMSSL
jgi:hypothetical protein